MADEILNYTIGEILTTADSALLWESIRQLQTESIIVKSVREEINKYVEENFNTETSEPENITKVYISDYESCTWGGSWRNITYGDVSTYTYPNALCCYEEKQRNKTEYEECFQTQQKLYDNNETRGNATCIQIARNPNSFPLYTQASFLTWLPLVAVILVLSFIFTTKRKSEKTSCFNGYLGYDFIGNDV